MSVLYLTGHVLDMLKLLPDNYVHCAVTSPPYWGLRKYDGGTNIDWGNWRGQLGAEPTIDLYISHLVEIFREVRRVLRPDGQFWLNIGDSAAGSGGAHKPEHANPGLDNSAIRSGVPSREATDGLKPLDTCLIPFRLALSLQSDGWYVHSDNIWSKCLAGNTSIYAKSGGVPVRTTVRELYRLINGKGLQLPDTHNKWCNVVKMVKIGKRKVVSVSLRSGYSVICTPEHRFSVGSVLVEAGKLTSGMILDNCRIQPEDNYSLITGYDHGYFIGWFLAEGNYEREAVRFSLSGDEMAIAIKLGEFAKSQFDAGYRIHRLRNDSLVLIIYNKTVVGFVKEYLDDKGAKRKHLSRKVWNTNKDFISGVLDGWLAGDGHWEKENNRYRLGFAGNPALADDIQVASTLLGYFYHRKWTWADCGGKKFTCYRGEIRKFKSTHPNNRSGYEVLKVEVLDAEQDVYDITVDSIDHLFALPDGTITHNSNPMPRSYNGWHFEQHRIKIKDRGTSKAGIDKQELIGSGNPHASRDGYESEWVDCPGCPKCSSSDGLVLRKGSWSPTESHEYIFQLVKSIPYFSDREAVKEPIAESTVGRKPVSFGGAKGRAYVPDESDPNFRNGTDQWGREFDYTESCVGGRNLRSVWEMPTQGFKGSHFAVFPPKLVEICVKASTSEYGVCDKCGSQWARVVDSSWQHKEQSAKARAVDVEGDPMFRQGHHNDGLPFEGNASTVGFRPTCTCNSGVSRPIILDPFGGAGTTSMVAERLNCDSIYIDSSPEYTELARARIADDEQKRVDEFIKKAKNSKK